MEEKIVNLGELYRKIKMIEQSMVTKKELESALESVMVFSNEDTMMQIEESEQDIRFRRFKKIDSVKDI